MSFCYLILKINKQLKNFSLVYIILFGRDFCFFFFFSLLFRVSLKSGQSMTLCDDYYCRRKQKTNKKRFSYIVIIFWIESHNWVAQFRSKLQWLDLNLKCDFNSNEASFILHNFYCIHFGLWMDTWFAYSFRQSRINIWNINLNRWLIINIPIYCFLDCIMLHFALESWLWYK